MPIDDLTALGQKMREARKNKELTELSEKFETNWASEWNLTILSLVLFISYKFNQIRKLTYTYQI